MNRTTHLHLDLQLILKDATELLDIVLHERIERFPAERFGELRSACKMGVSRAVIQ